MPRKWEEALIPTPPGIINYREMQFMPHKKITLDATFIVAFHVFWWAF